MSELLDYGAPEDSASASFPTQLDQRIQTTGPRYYAPPKPVPLAPDHGPSDPSDELVDAKQLLPRNPENDLTPVPDQPDGSVAQSVGLGRVRMNALHVFGAPVTQLSTSRLFAWLVECGASPLAIEWVNDFSCNVVFRDAPTALRGLEHLMLPPTHEEWDSAVALAQKQQEEAFTFGQAEAEAPMESIAVPNDPVTSVPLPKVEEMMAFLSRSNATSGDKAQDPDSETNPDQEQEVQSHVEESLGISLLTSRKLYPVPLKIFTPTERDAARRLLQKRQNEMRREEPSVGDFDMADGEETDIRREGGGETARRPSGPVAGAGSSLPPPSGSLPHKPDFDLDGIIKLCSTLYARFSVAEFDQKQKRAREQSEWYRLHGTDAGREVVPLLNIGSIGSKEALEERELLDLPVLERRMRTAAQPEPRRRGRDRSLSPGRNDDVLVSLGSDSVVSGIRIRGRGTVRAPEHDEPTRSRGRGHVSRGTEAWAGEEEDEALLESDKIELSKRLSSVSAQARSVPGKALEDRLKPPDLGSRVAPGPSLLDRLGGVGDLLASTKGQGRRPGRW